MIPLACSLDAYSYSYCAFVLLVLILLVVCALIRCLVIEAADRASAHQLLTESEFLNGATSAALAGPCVTSPIGGVGDATPALLQTVIPRSDSIS